MSKDGMRKVWAFAISALTAGASSMSIERA